MSEETKEGEFDPMFGAYAPKKKLPEISPEQVPEEKINDIMDLEGGFSFSSCKEMKNVLKKEVYDNKKGNFVSPDKISFGGSKGEVFSNKNSKEEEKINKLKIPMSGYREYSKELEEETPS